MARGTSEHKGGVFLDIRGGYVCERVSEPGEGIHERTIEKGPNKGAIVYERRDGYVEGVINRLVNQERESNVSGKVEKTVTLQVHLSDAGENFILNLPKGYKVWRHFLLTLPNLKPGAIVRFEPYDYVGKKDGKRKTGLGILQDGEQVKWAYTRNDGVLPDAPMVKVSGKDMVDYTEQDIFLEMVLEKEGAKFNSRPEQKTALDAAAEHATQKASAPAQGRSVTVYGSDNTDMMDAPIDDDLPF